MADPFDLAAQVVARHRAYGPIASTQYQDAAKAARVNQLARQAGLPADVVDADFSNVEADQRVQQGQALASTTPQAAAWLAQPRNAAAVSNDYHGLTPLASALSSTADPKVLAAPQPNQSYLGSLWQGTKNLVGGLGQTLLSGGKQSYSALENVAGGIVAHTVDPISAAVGGGQLGARMQAQSRRIAASAQPSDTENYYNDWHYSDLWHNPGNFARKVVPGNAFQMVRSLPMMAETMVGGGAPAAVDITEQTAQARARNNGRPSPSAWDYAISLPVGIISAALFRGARTGDVAAGVAAPVKPLISSLAETALRDSAIGGGQAGLQYTGETAGTDKGFSYGEMLSQSAQGAAGNAIFGVALHSASAAVATPIRRMRDVAVARDGVDYVDNIMDAAQRARSRQQSPEEFQSFVDAHVKDGPAENLYIPGEAVSALFQTTEGEPSPRRIEQDPFWAKYAPAIDEAQRIGGDVVVPLSDIATHLAGSSDWNQLREQVRFNPGGMSLAEAREYSTKQAPEDIEKAVAELSGKMDAATGDLQALRKTYQFGRDLGLPHDQAVAFGAVQRDWIVRRNEIENAGRAARGEAPLTPGEEWDSLNLRPEKTTQAEHERIKTVAVRSGVEADANLVREAHAYVKAGKPHEEALHAAVEDDAGRALDKAASEAANQEYSHGKEEFHERRQAEERARTSPSGGEGPEGVGTDAGGRSEGGEEPAGDAGSDAGETEANATGVDAGSGPDAAQPIDPRAEWLRGLRPGQGELFQSDKRGSISLSRNESGDPMGAVIRSFESANISTALHEMGHYWIEDLRARALSAGAPEELKADWQAVKDWFGENGHALDQGEAIPEAAHELWARGVERYIMEGKAPSQRLAGAFARLAQWMRKLYQSVTALNAPISPEVRGVMDRMLASNSEIEAARGDLKMNPLEGAEALMTESERVAYHSIASESRNEAYQTLLERVMETVRNRRTREYNEQKRNVKDTVTGDVDAMPVHRALKLLRKGEDGERVKLPKQWLTDNYGENATDTLPKGVDPIWADEGHDPEEIADRSGFDNADQMVRALQDHATAKEALKAAEDKRSPRQALIDETTKQRIESDIPDPYQDIEQEARAAVANDKAGDLMSMEARALARKTGRTPTLWAKAKEWAAGHLQTQSVRDALTGAALARYSRSVAKAGKLTEEALYKGDFEQALTHKNQQILNAALLQEAKRVKEEVETASRKLKRIADARTMKSIDQDYLDQAHALLDQVRMGTETGKRVEKIKSFEKWYNEQVAEGREPIVPIEYSRLLGTVHWTSMKVGDLMELNDVVGQIVNLGRLKQKLLDGKEERDYEGAVGELVERQQENPRLRKQTSLNDPKNSGVERVKARFRSADAVMLKFEQLMNFMDNAQPNGPWQRMLMNPISAAQAKQSRLLRPLLEDIKGALTRVPKETLRSWTREVDTPELANWVAPHDDPRFGKPWRFTKDQLISMALNLGNDGNKQRLLDGYHFNEADVRAVLDRNLSAEEWRFVQDTWDTVGKLWPEIAEMERRVNGFAPEKVEPTPVETPHGTLEGGYFPAIYDPLYSSHAEVEEVQKLTGGGFFSVNTRAGATHERADQVKRPLLLSISTVTRHLNEVVHDIAFREPAAQVRRLLKDDRIKQAISSLMGPEYHKNSLEWLENVAKPNVADSKQNQTIMAFARALNKRITTAGLGFRVSTILQQPASFSNTMAEVGNVRYAKFFAKYLSSPVESWRQVSELSEEMRDRAHNLDANINALYEQQAKNKLVVGPSKITELAFKGIAATDLFITVPGWLAAFDKATVDLKMNDDDAVHYADMVIRKTQGAGSTKDQAAIQRTAWLKAFNPFFSYWSAHYNQLRSIGHEARRVRDTDHMFNLANRFVLAAILPMAIQGWFFGGPQSTNADGSKESDVHYLLKAIMLGNMGAIPGVSAVTNAVGYGYPYKVSPWSRFFESAKQVGTDIKKGYSYEEGDGEAPKSWIKDSLDALAYFSGKPTSQLGATLQGVYDYGTNKAHPETVGEWNDLLARGKVPQHDR